MSGYAVRGVTFDRVVNACQPLAGRLSGALFEHARHWMIGPPVGRDVVVDAIKCGVK